MVKNTISEELQQKTTRIIEEVCGKDGLEAYLNLSKQEAIEVSTLALFEAFDIRIEEAPNPNPHQYQIDSFVRKIKGILEEEYEPNAFVSIHSFRVWWDRKNGIIKDYWESYPPTNKPDVS